MQHCPSYVNILNCKARGEGKWTTQQRHWHTCLSTNTYTLNCHTLRRPCTMDYASNYMCTECCDSVIQMSMVSLLHGINCCWWCMFVRLFHVTWCWREAHVSTVQTDILSILNCTYYVGTTPNSDNTLNSNSCNIIHALFLHVTVLWVCVRGGGGERGGSIYIMPEPAWLPDCRNTLRENVKCVLVRYPKHTHAVCSCHCKTFHTTPLPMECN